MAQRLGHIVESIDYSGIHDPDTRVAKLLSHVNQLNDSQDIVLVGSSMGGYVALLAAAELQPKGVFLLAPALYMPGYEGKDYPVDQNNVSIVHGWKDEIIPFQNSLKYAEQNQSDLHLLADGHRLVEILAQTEKIFAEFLNRLVT